MRHALAALALLLPSGAWAQRMGPNMPGMPMPGMTMPSRPAPAKPPPKRKPAPTRAPSVATKPRPTAPAAPTPAMRDMPGMAMPDTPPVPAAAAGTTLPAGDVPPPPPPADRAADRFYSPAAMAAADRMMRHEHGGMAIAQVMLNLAELQVRGGRAGYRWEGQGRFGGDIDRLVIRSEGEGRFGRAVDDAEAQALWAHAIGPYFDLQAGIRGDVGPTRRGYATIGLEGLAPYGLEIAGALFLSHRGDLLARVEGYHDLRVTQRLILQPRAELNFAAQAVPASHLGAGLATAELGLRLRYEIAHAVAPYAGVSWDRRTGAGARLARAAGEPAGTTALVLGVRVRF